MARTDEVGVRARIVGTRKFLAETQAMARGLDAIKDAANRADRRIAAANIRIQGLRNTFALVRPFALVTGLGLVAQGLSGIAAGATAATSALAPLGGTMVGIPTTALAAAQGMRAWGLAMEGVMDAVGGLNEVLDEEKLEGLTPAAQRLARELDRMKFPILEIQRATQDGLFPGMRAGLRAVRPLLRNIRDEMGLTGTVMGQLLRDAGRMVSSGPFSRDLQDQMRYNARWMRTMGRAGLDLVDALRHILVAARPLVSWGVRLAASWAENIRNWAKAGRESGKLAEFFERTRWVLTRVFSIVGALATGFGSVFEAARPLGEDILWSLDKSAERWAQWTRSVEGQNSLRQYFEQARPLVFEMGRLIRDVALAFFRLGTQPGAAPLVRQFRTEVLPALVAVIDKITHDFGPALMDALVSFAELAVVLADSAGPLTILVKFLGLMADALRWIVENIPLAGELLGAILAGGAVRKIMAMILSPFAGILEWLIVRLLPLLGTLIGRLLPLLASPLGLVVLAVIALGVAIFLLVKHFGKVKDAAVSVFNTVKDAVGDAAGWVVDRLQGAFNTVKDALGDAAGWMVDRFRGAFNTIKDAVVSAFNTIKNAVRDAVRWIVDRLRDFLGFLGRVARKIRNAPGIKQALDLAGRGAGVVGDAVGGIFGKVFPGAASGGIVRQSGAVLVGERGPELLSLPRGARVDPLPSINPVRRSTVPDVAGALQAHTRLDLTVRVPVNIDGRKVTEAVGRVTRDRVNRR